MPLFCQSPHVCSLLHMPPLPCLACPLPPRGTFLTFLRHFTCIIVFITLSAKEWVNVEGVAHRFSALSTTTIVLFPSPPYYANKKWFVTPLDGHQNRRQSSPHKRTASTICQFQVQQRSLLWWTIQKKWTRICWYYSESSMITSKNVTKIVVLRISGSLLNTVLTLINSIF